MLGFPFVQLVNSAISIVIASNRFSTSKPRPNAEPDRRESTAIRLRSPGLRPEKVQ
jgi:hypothetical protein